VEDLGDKRDSRAIRPLVAMLGDDSAAVREAAIDALSHVATDQTITSVVPLLSSEDAPERNAACVVLRNVGLPAISHLCPLLNAEDKDVRKFAVDVLASIGSPLAVDALVAAMRDADVNVAGAAAEALGRIGSALAIPAMLRSLSGNNWLTCTVVQSLALIGGPVARGALHEFINDKDEMVAFAAVQALGRVGDETSLVHLQSLLRCGNSMIGSTARSTIQLILDRADPDIAKSLREKMSTQLGVPAAR
jgi:HEAT repeat protein